MAASRARAWDLTALALFAVLALALNAPLLPVLTTAVPSDVGDPILNTWILWWNAQTAPWSSAYWNAPAFAPAPYALALSETLLGLTPITTPLQWLGASPLLAYNVLYVLTPFLNGAAAYALCRSLTGRREAALVGGLYFMLAPYRAAQLPHVQTLATFYMPLALLGLHEYWRTGRRRWLACLLAATIGNGLVSGYHLVYFAAPLAVALVWMTASARDWRRPAAVAGTLALAGLAFLPVLVPYQQVHAHWELRRGVEEMFRFSADVASFLSAAPGLWLQPLPKLIDIPEADVYPGLALLACLAPGVIVWWQRRSDAGTAALPKWATALRIVLLVVATGAAIAAIGRWLHGPFDLDLGPLHVSVTTLYKPLGAAFSALLLSAALSPRTWASARRGGEAGMYIAVWVIATVLMLGPEGRLMGTRIWYKAPAAWLLEFPGLDTVRVPARWASIQILASAVLCALAVAAWRQRHPRTAPLVAVLALAIALDGWYILTVAPAPTALAVPIRADLVVELPMHGWAEDAAAMYRGMSHGRPVVNGYSGYGPPHYEALSFDLHNGCLESLDAVRGGRSLDVVVHTDAVDGAATLETVRGQWPDAPEDRSGSVVVRHVAPSPSRATTAHDDPIDLRNFCHSIREAAANTP